MRKPCPHNKDQHIEYDDGVWCNGCESYVMWFEDHIMYDARSISEKLAIETNRPKEVFEADNYDFPNLDDMTFTCLNCGEEIGYKKEHSC